jgi:translocation and assembly module TamB
MRRLLAIAALSLLPFPGLAQDAESERDRGIVQRLLEDNLSGAGRVVRIEGFAGALSSRATFAELTIADDLGTWLTLRGGAIAWNRAALLQGRIEIAEMRAAEILLPRLPQAGAAATAPEAVPFALPELPVSVSIGTVAAARVELGAAVLGSAAVVALDGALQLAGGEGNARLTITRIDGRRGQLALSASFANATRALELDLLVEEGADGIAAGLIGLPGRPALTLAAAGSGPLDSFSADIVLSTDGVRRLAGGVTLGASGAGTGRFRAAFGGDIAPLLAPAYRDFFGAEVQLLAEGRRGAGGQLELSTFVVTTRALRVAGSAVLATSGLPESAALEVTLGLDDGAEVLLPLAGAPTWVRGASLTLDYARAQGEGWLLAGQIAGLRRGAAQIGTVAVKGSGRVRHDVTPGLGGTLRFDAERIALADPALAQALGEAVAGSTTFSWTRGQPLQLSQLHVTGGGGALQGQIAVSQPGADLEISGSVQAQFDDLARFSALAGRPLAGGASGTLRGSYHPLSGGFDLQAVLRTIDLGTGQTELDRLLQGSAMLNTSARRDAGGLTLEAFDLVAPGLTASASGTFRSTMTTLSAQLDLPDLAVLGRGWNGGLRATTSVSGSPGAREVRVEGTGTALALGQPQPDRLLAGDTVLRLKARETADGLALNTFDLANPQLSLAVAGAAGTGYDVAATLANVALLAPGISGPLRLDGTVQPQAGRYALSLAAAGPGGTDAAITGSVSADLASLDLAVTGRAEAALANVLIAPRSLQGPLEFNLRLIGAPALAALSGRLSGAGLRYADATLGLALQDISAVANISDGAAQLSAIAAPASGGALRGAGRVSLSAPFAADLALMLERIRLRDPDLYAATLSGALNITGPLGGGALVTGELALAEAELRVPDTLGALVLIPEITHLGEPAAVNATRRRAGLLQTKARQAPGKAYRLDIGVSAPRAIFVRGRGLDAELGGALRLSGSSANIIPIGQFDLIRGRLDILGKRFSLTEGQVQLQGEFTPWLRFVAASAQDGLTATITLEGAANAPVLSFASSPDLPEEEVLAQLLFARGIENLSPFQAAQLAQAVATLAGRGGEGLVARLRNAIGLDDLDITTDIAGTATLRAGKYVAENIYADVAVTSQGSSEINLNLDLSPSLTARGTLDNAGNSKVGLFWERDY